MSAAGGLSSRPTGDDGMLPGPCGGSEAHSSTPSWTKSGLMRVTTSSITERYTLAVSFCRVDMLLSDRQRFPGWERRNGERRPYMHRRGRTVETLQHPILLLELTLWMRPKLSVCLRTTEHLGDTGVQLCSQALSAGCRLRPCPCELEVVSYLSTTTRLVAARPSHLSRCVRQCKL